MKQSVSQEQLDEWLQIPIVNISVIDVRSNEEFEARNIPSSENIPAESLKQKSGTWNKNSTVVCVCNHGGQRSQNAAEQLSEAGFKNVFFLEGGVAKWFEEQDK